MIRRTPRSTQSRSSAASDVYKRQTDRLAHTLNYQDVFLLVKEQMAIKSNLLEHVGRRILVSLKEHFPEIISAKVKVSKMNPPLGGKIGSVSLLLEI